MKVVMKSIFYLSALSMRSLSSMGKIIYCQMLYMSVWDTKEESFTKTGEFDPYQGIDATGYKYIPVGDNCTETILRDITGISHSQLYEIRKDLFRCALLMKGDVPGGYDYIRLEKGYLDSFIELIRVPKLNNLNLIVYSYICNKTKKFGWIDKYHDAIARELGISPLVLANCLRKLHAMGLVQKKKRYKQVLLRAAPEFYIP